MTKRLSIELWEIDQQRDLGWPDFHPEEYCHRCGGINLTWYVDSDRFNTAMGGADNNMRWNGIICPGCFVQLHEEATGMYASWKLVPDMFRWPDIEDVMARHRKSDEASTS